MPDPTATSSDAELNALVERALTANYELDRELGRGGMGIVYRAKDRRLKRMVAIKVLPPELGFRGEIKSRFLREAETAAQLSHPDIVPIYSVDEREGLVFFVMACVDGDTLAKRLAERGPLPVDDARRILREVADALAYAHARGVIHRDIKPDNILLGEDGRAMVTDFGIARAIQEGADSRLTATGVAIGTPAYMSPEQAAGDREIDGRSDLYSLGIVGYQMLAGQLPFQASSTAAMLMKHISERPAPLDQVRPDVPADLSAAVMTLLEKEPSNRFPSAAAFEAVMAGDMSQMPARTAQSTAPQPAWAPPPTTSQATWGPPHTSPLPVAPYPSYGAAALPNQGRHTTPTPDEIARWSAPEVQHFRSQFLKYFSVNAVIVVASVFWNSGLLFVTVLWSMVMAARYSRLWSAGYDWRDVFRQPRDRRLIDVASETVEQAQSVFDKKKREELRLREQKARAALPSPTTPGGTPVADFGRYTDTVRRAEVDRGEILRLVMSLPASDQNLVEGVIPAAEGLYHRVQSLALSLVDLDRTSRPDDAERIEREIATLEAQANPLDYAASEERVRRLARLKRDRRAVADAVHRRSDTWGKLESCALALQGMRVDVLRLRAGGVASVSQHITLLTERARSLADEVDAAVGGVEEARRTAGTRGAARGAR
ncbi:MAG TPA: serine/threonine-protein kinase [Gemmatimonadaceae bacterium]|nr:serine/threonine-protein kinase [Gemmatimonadaceae bacterium]